MPLYSLLPPGKSRGRDLFLGGKSCHIPNLETKKNLVSQEPNFRTNKNFLKCFTDDCVLLPIAVLTLCDLGCDADLILFVSCENNSSAVLNTKIKPTGHKFGM